MQPENPPDDKKPDIQNIQTGDIDAGIANVGGNMTIYGDAIVNKGSGNLTVNSHWWNTFSVFSLNFNACSTLALR